MDSLPFCPIALPAKRAPCPFPNRLNAITQSPLRPNVAAPDHFVHWLTPFGINSMNRAAENFPPETITCKRFVLTQCVKPETLSNYSAGLLHFTCFCDDFRIPEATRMPAKESLLCRFITSHGAGHVGKGTLTSWLARAQHEYKYFHGYLWVHPWENLYKQITCLQVPSA